MEQAFQGSVEEAVQESVEQDVQESVEKAVYFATNTNAVLETILQYMLSTLYSVGHVELFEIHLKFDDIVLVHKRTIQVPMSFTDLPGRPYRKTITLEV